MPPRGRKGLTVRSSVCSMSMRSFVALIRALSVTAMQRTHPEAHAIYRRYSDQIDDRYESMEEADIKKRMV